MSSPNQRASVLDHHQFDFVHGRGYLSKCLQQQQAGASQYLHIKNPASVSDLPAISHSQGVISSFQVKLLEGELYHLKDGKQTTAQNTRCLQWGENRKRQDTEKEDNTVAVCKTAALNCDLQRSSQIQKYKIYSLDCSWFFSSLDLMWTKKEKTKSNFLLKQQTSTRSFYTKDCHLN